jgi:hypothetical protein
MKRIILGFLGFVSLFQMSDTLLADQIEGSTKPRDYLNCDIDFFYNYPKFNNISKSAPVDPTTSSVVFKIKDVSGFLFTAWVEYADDRKQYEVLAQVTSPFSEASSMSNGWNFTRGQFFTDSRKGVAYLCSLDDQPR